MRRGITTFILLVIVVGGFGVLLARNAQPVAPITAALPTQFNPTEHPNLISELLQQNLGENSTALPTVAIPTTNPIPTQALQQPATATLISAQELSSGLPTEAAIAISTPTLPQPVSVGTGTASSDATVQAVTPIPVERQPPPLIPPISRDPLGRDHYWFHRPVDSNANNTVLSYYSFGSDGPDVSNPLRVHHGIDMPNPVGVPVRAAGSGVVIWAADGRQQEAVSIFQNSPSYGNVIVIEHDFSFKGQKLWTLYAHLSASFVQQGDVVQGGQVIGQIGNSGRVSGPHVHFEVRLNENTYGTTYNPVLWMVPYVGHGVIAGQVVDREGFPVIDAEITIRSRATGLTVRTTTSYVILDTGFDVNSDPNWEENFAVADVPTGRYDVIATIYGERVIKQVEVREGTTSFIEVKPADPVTPDATATPAS